jgi:hypothetical protein
VSEVSFPGPGPDGEQPPPGGPARDDDWDGDAEMAAYIAGLDAGRARIPEEWEVEGPAATISLGDAADVDLVELAAMVGPDGLGGEVFARDRTADVMRPGPVLSALTEQATGDLGRLTDNQVVGVMSAAGRLAARAEYLRLAAVAEFTRRRELQLADATARLAAHLDLTQGRDPLGRLAGPEPADDAGRDARQDKPAAGGQPGDGDHGDDDDASWDGCPDMTEWQRERRGTAEDDDHPDTPGAPPGPPAPFPALINLTVPAGTAYGWSAAPGEAGGWGLTDPGDTRRLLQAASAHPRTRWCVTLLGPDGTAVAHGCARGPRPWIPPPQGGQRNLPRPRLRRPRVPQRPRPHCDPGHSPRGT